MLIFPSHAMAISQLNLWKPCQAESLALQLDEASYAEQMQIWPIEALALLNIQKPWFKGLVLKLFDQVFQVVDIS